MIITYTTSNSLANINIFYPLMYNNNNNNNTYTYLILSIIIIIIIIINKLMTKDSS